MKKIDYYRSESGNNPIQDFLDSLSSDQRKKVLWVLELVQEQDRIPTKFFKKLVSTDGIWEIRVRLGNDIFRLLGFLDNNIVILTNGFVKKTQTTPPQEIAIAEQRKKDYLARRKK
jgi:phage-related protein